MSEMSDKEFIGYCQLHSKTPRALFHIKHIRRLYELAGEEFTSNATDGFFTMRADEAHPLCEKANNRVK